MTSRHHHSVTNVQKQKNTNRIKHDGTSASLMKKISCFLLLEMKQDQKHNLVQRSQRFLSLKKKIIISLMYTNPAAGSLHHKCYDPGKPNNHTTVQFLIMLQWSYHQMYYSPFKKNRKTALQKRKCPKISSSSSSSIYIYPYVYIHTPNHRDTHIFVKKKTSCFFHKVTHTLSPGAYIYTIVFCCVRFVFFYSEKKI